LKADRIKWNRRFDSKSSFLGEHPSLFLSHEIDRIKRLVPGKLALDIACGEGRNSVFLARQGFEVTGLDISDVGISKGMQLAAKAGVIIDFRRVDLDGYHITGRFDLIINFNFLLRELIPEEFRALAPGGVLLFDSILESPQLLASHNPDYFLRHRELEEMFGAFDGQILFTEESNDGVMPTARMLFRKAG
jgi:tellurite methyltransferase